MRTATTMPDISVTSATAWIAAPHPRASAMTPAMSAPTAYPPGRLAQDQNAELVPRGRRRKPLIRRRVVIDAWPLTGVAAPQPRRRCPSSAVSETTMV
jgi:hypothetical protein